MAERVLKNCGPDCMVICGCLDDRLTALEKVCDAALEVKTDHETHCAAVWSMSADHESKCNCSLARFREAMAACASI